MEPSSTHEKRFDLQSVLVVEILQRLGNNEESPEAGLIS
jgi:hypothetical protein